MSAFPRPAMCEIPSLLVSQFWTFAVQYAKQPEQIEKLGVQEISRFFTGLCRVLSAAMDKEYLVFLRITPRQAAVRELAIAVNQLKIFETVSELAEYIWCQAPPACRSEDLAHCVRLDYSVQLPVSVAAVGDTLWTPVWLPVSEEHLGQLVAVWRQKAGLVSSAVKHDPYPE